MSAVTIRQRRCRCQKLLVRYEQEWIPLSAEVSLTTSHVEIIMTLPNPTLQKQRRSIEYRHMKSSTPKHFTVFALAGKKMLFSIWLLWLRGRSPQFVFLRRGILSAPIFVTTFQKLCASLWYVSSWRTRKNLKTAITANTQVYTQCLHWSVSNLMTFYRFSLKAPAWNTVEFFFFPKLTP